MPWNILVPLHALEDLGSKSLSTCLHHPLANLVLMQEQLIAEATALSSSLTLPDLSSEIVNGIMDSTKKVEKTAAGFVPFLHNTATAPPNTGITLTLNVTEVNVESVASSDSPRS